MKLEQYQEQAKRTNADLGSEKLNLAHMVLGLVSEQEEYLEASVKEDEVNQREELADMCWYIANYCEMRGYKFHELLKQCQFFFEPNDEWIEQVSYMDVYVSKLADYVKKYVAYGKPIIRAKEKEALKGILYSLTLEECYFDFERDLRNNIEKLKVRFPEKFTQEKALNRDLETERKILEKDV